MYSRARVAGHPIHPIVVGFPIALETATVVALCAYVASDDPFYYRAAMVANTAGVAMALVAAIAGAIELFALPRRSRAWATGIKHASFALLTTGLFALSAALLYRGWTGRALVDGRWALDATLPLAIGILGMATLGVAGVLGWTLVQTHHVGIQPMPVSPPPPSPEPEPELDDFENFPTPLLGGDSSATGDLDPLRH